MKRMLPGLAAAAAVALAPAIASADTTLRLLSSWDKSNWPTYVVADKFQKMVDKNSGGNIKIEISGPEVVPPFEQLQPVSAGVFDMLYTHGVYHAGSKGLSLVVDAIELDVEKRRSSGVIDFIDQYYQKNSNLKLIAMVAQSNQGYHIFLKQPLTDAGDLEGRKIRGTQTYHGIIRALGGSPVVLPGSEIYTALEKGVIDGAAWPAAGMVTMKHYEVAKYRVRPTFGSSNEPILMNLDKWNELSKADQQLLLETGKELEKIMPAIGDEILAEESAQLEKFGVKTIQWPPEKVELINREWSESVWKLAEQCCGDGATELKALAAKAGLIK